MTDDRPVDGVRSESTDATIARGGQKAGASGLPSDGGVAEAAPVDPATSKNLTAEEQMALYENDLKENDWGHQPC